MHILLPLPLMLGLTHLHLDSQSTAKVHFTYNTLEGGVPQVELEHCHGNNLSFFLNA